MKSHAYHDVCSEAGGKFITKEVSKTVIDEAIQSFQSGNSLEQVRTMIVARPNCSLLHRE